MQSSYDLSVDVGRDVSAIVKVSQDVPLPSFLKFTLVLSIWLGIEVISFVNQKHECTNNNKERLVTSLFVSQIPSLSSHRSSQHCLCLCFGVVPVSALSHHCSVTHCVHLFQVNPLLDCLLMPKGV